MSAYWGFCGGHSRQEVKSTTAPFEERAGLPDVGVANAASGRLRDVLLLKELLDGLSHHGHGVVDVGRLVLPVDELEPDQTWRVDQTAVSEHRAAAADSGIFLRPPGF